MTPPLRISIKASFDRAQSVAAHYGLSANHQVRTRVLSEVSASRIEVDVCLTTPTGRLRFDEARDDLINYHKAHRRDTKKLEGRIKLHLTPYFGRRKMTEITRGALLEIVALRHQLVVTSRSRP